MSDSPAPAAGSGPGPVRAWLGPWLELLQVRLQLLALEAEEEVHRLGALLAWGAVAAVCLGLAAVCGAVLLTVLFWEEHRVAVLASLLALFLAAGGVAVAMALARIRQGSQLFVASLAELRRDLERLRA